MAEALTTELAVTAGSKTSTQPNIATLAAISVDSNDELEEKQMDIFDEMDAFETLEISAIHKKMSAKKRIWKYCKYIVLYTYFIFSKSLSLIDLITDLILLQKAVKYSYIELTVVLFLSILAPYIISYSSGVKLFLFRRTFDSFRGFETWLMVFYILPTGILYFILLDLIDATFCIYRCFAYTILQKTHEDLKESEEILAEQLGMNRMNYEGFKRQKTVGQLFFETLPQCTLQALLFFKVMEGRETSKITQQDLLISIIAAIVNSIGQLIRLYWESNAVHEHLLQYALNCIVGRVGWVPFVEQLKIIQNDANSIRNDKMYQSVSRDKDGIEIFIDYCIEYNVPIATKCIGYKGKMEFDFSAITISHFIATLSIMSLKNDNDDNENSSMKMKNVTLIINFSSSLRFLSIHDIVLLFNVCSERNIILPDIDRLIDWKQAILFSIKHGKDISNITNARLDNEPILNAIYKSGYDPNKKILIALLKHSDIDINLTNETGESIIHLFIKHKDYRGLLLIFKYCNKKNIHINMNYYDIKGYSPLYLALNQYHDEQKQRERNKQSEAVKAEKNKLKKYLYEMLILYGNAHSNYPLNSDGLSPLAFVLINLKDFELALKLCNDYKARLQSYEITILPSLFLQLVKRDNMDEMVTNRYLDIILNICGQCYIDLDGIKDEHRNNPLHFLIKNAGWSRKQSTKTFFLRLLKYLLPLKHNNWLQQKNKDDLVPTALAFSLNALQIDTIQCLIDFDASIKQFCIDYHMDSIINSVLDLVTFSIQFMDQKNENSETDHYTSKLKAIFDIFINDNDLIQSKLISECLQLKLIQQIQYLCKEDNQWQCRMNETQQQRFEILEEQQVGQKLLLPRQIREGIRQKRQEQKAAHDEHVYDDYKYDEQNKMSNKPKMIVMSSEDDMDLIENMSVDSNDRIQTAKTIKLMDDSDANQQKQLDGNNKKRTNWIELVYGLTVESLSSLDLITDAIVLVELYRAKHVVWTTLMVFATICPYLVSYSVLITLFQKKSSNKNVSSFIRFLIGIFFMTPVCIIYFILIDVSFMFYVILSTLFFFISCGYIDIKDFIDDYIFKKLFNLSRMQIIGYRRLRTLSQLTFETIPQIFLQLRILQESQNEVTGVDTTNLMISIGIAIFHLIFEAIIISLDSRACYLSFYHYSIICLGARLKWIPYSNLFHSIHSISKNDSKKAQDPKQLKKQQINAKMMTMKTYNYENIRSTTCGVAYNVDYIFTNESVRNLAEQLTVLPKIIAEKWKMSKTLITKTENLWTIKLGSHCCKDIDLYSIADLFRACNGRINIDASTINWYELIFTNTDIRYLSYSPANLSAITKTFLECGDFEVTTYLLDSRFGGHYNVNFVKAAMIRFGVLFALRKFYCGLVLFGLDKSSRNFIFYIMYYRLKTALSLNDKSYLKSAFMLLWYSSRAIFNDNTYLMDAEDKTECNVLFQFNEIQENEDDNEFEVQIDNVERGYDANEQGNVDFNFQVNAVEINSINSRKDSMQRFFAKTTKKYFENKKFQLVINDGDIESALQLSFRLAECFMCFHPQIELFLLTLFDDIIEQTNGNNINMRTKFKKDNNIYILTYNDCDNIGNTANDGEIKEIYNSAMGQSEEDDKYWHVSAQIMTQKHIDLLEYIVSTPAKSIRLSSEQYELMQEMDGLLRKKWKMFHQFNKYIHLMQDTYDRFRPQTVEIDTVHVRPNENRVIFDIPLPTTIGLETVRITFEDILMNSEESDRQETTNNPDRIMGIIYLDISPLWTLPKQKGMIHPKHYDTVRWNKIILHKFTKQTLIRHKTPIIDLPANAEIFNFNPSVSDIALKMELSADAGEHIMCNTVKVALSYYVTLYEQPYHDEKYAYGYSQNALQRVATTVAPVMKLDSNKSDDSRKCCAKSSTQMSDVQMEKALKQRVAQSKKEQRLTKTILLLGIANSGKQTWLKQMNTIYGEGFTDYDRKEEYEAMIHGAIKSNMVALINGIGQLSDSNNAMSNEEKDAMHYILQCNNAELVEEKKKDDSMDEIYANNIEILWKCNEIREVYNNRNVIAVVVDDSCAYFFDGIRRICRNQYVPSDKDILLVRNRSFDHEIRQISFDTRGTMFKLINPGNNRKIWVHSFNDKVTAMVYLASLSCYNEVSEQDNDENAMMESIELFASVINRREFQSVAQLLFLNKKDVFAEKIQTVPLSVCFADYDGQDTFDESVSFIKERFDEQNQNPREKQIYTHVCCATDKSNVGRVFSDLSHIVVNQSLMRSGLT